MKCLILVFFLLCLPLGFSQTVFSETFDEADDETTGTDAIGAVAWTALCPGSVAVDDYFKVVSGKLEAQDTNGPAATWTTDDIDISACTLGLTISLSLENVGDMEECADCGGTGTNCVDWVKLEYNVDGAGWLEVAGTTCGLALSPGEMIQIGDIPFGGPLDFNSPCLDFGTTLQIRISCMCWAGDEIWQFDNIMVNCLDCTLPAEVDNFSITPIHPNSNLISWSTLTERNTDYFTLESSFDGVNFNFISKINAAGNSIERINYSYEDFNPFKQKITIYRLKQYDFDGKMTFSETISIHNPYDINVFLSGNQVECQFNGTDNKLKTINIYNIKGQLVQSHQVIDNISIPMAQSGFYIIEIPELAYRQKLLIP